MIRLVAAPGSKAVNGYFVFSPFFPVIDSYEEANLEALLTAYL
jgi:hypothetical protein